VLKRIVVLRRLTYAWLASLALLGVAPQPEPSVEPTPNAAAERLFERAKTAWRARSDLPYLRYGALVRYLHDGHVFDNWWDAYFRTSDGSLSLMRLVDIAEDKRRLGGIPFSIFGLKVFDTNADAEPIRLDPPRLAPIDSFGVVGREMRPGARPAPITSPSAPEETPDPKATPLREITHVEIAPREYQVEIVGNEQVMDIATVHLHLTPLRDPDIHRLRDLWLDSATNRTVQLDVHGILSGEPYDKVDWTVRYVELDGRNYVQQIIADQPLRFGFDTVIPKFEIDLVDYHYPTDVPKFTFDRPF